ncbi:unnamed protein product [Periconia digitata]|uniref:Uncharacterized protein n=1 Tax=Periconia digitata TaxID=1303443 RepID=A0A9W4XSL7_9PLEO|nr:unnamed protein product [Periconia digitata]
MTSCYFQNGREVTDKYPCNNTAVAEGKHTACCSNSLQCLTNGLCRDEQQDATRNYYWRTACTDKTFQDPACANYCPDNSRSTTLVWKCRESEKWCCNGGAIAPLEERIKQPNETCCAIDELVFKAPDPVVYTKAQSLFFTVSTMSTTTAPTTSSTPDLKTATSSTLESPPTPPPPSSNTNNNSTESSHPHSHDNDPHTTPPPPNHLAIGLGIGLGITILLSLIALIWWLRRRRSSRPPKPKNREMTRAFEASGQEISEAMSQGVSELMGSEVCLVEMHTDADSKYAQVVAMTSGRTSLSAARA